MPLEAQFVCFLAALACFVLAAASVTLHPRLSLVAAGLAFWVLVPFWTTLEAL